MIESVNHVSVLEPFYVISV